MDLNAGSQPFSPVPDVKSWFPVESMRIVEKSIFRCLDRAEGAAIVFGESGLGKTLLLCHLASQFGDNDPVILLDTRINDAKSLLQQIMFALKQTWCGCTETELRLMLRHYINNIDCQRIILLLDNAQIFRSSVFEEINSLLDIQTQGRPLFRIALTGTRRLEDHLTSPKLSAFNQRVVFRGWLEPFNYDETQAYLITELKRLASDSQLFELGISKEAVKEIYKNTSGVPRIINQLARLSVHLLLADLQEQGQTGIVSQNLFEISPNIVQRAWSELQQIPLSQIVGEPKTTNSVSKSSNSDSNNSLQTNSQIDTPTLEFGTLEGDSSDLLESNESHEEVKSDELSKQQLNSRCQEKSDPVTIPIELFAETEEQFESESETTEQECHENILEFGALSDGSSKNSTDPVETNNETVSKICPARSDSNRSDDGIAIEISPDRSGIDLADLPMKKGKSSEKSLANGQTALMSIEKPVFDRVRFVTKEDQSTGEISGKVRSKTPDCQKIEFHESHSSTDLFHFSTIVDRCNSQTDQSNTSSNSSDGLDHIQDVDLGIEKAHSAAFKQGQQETEEKKKEKTSVTRRNVFQQIYDEGQKDQFRHN